MNIEEYVAAGLLKYGEEIWVEVGEILDKRCFIAPHTQLVFLLVENIIHSDRVVDMTTLSSASLRIKRDEVFERYENKIADMLDVNIDFQNVVSYSKQLVKQSIIRELQGQLKSAYDKAAEMDGAEPLDNIIAVAEKPGYSILDMLNTADDRRPQSISTATHEVLERIENPIEMVGLPTPWPKFNRAIGGGLRNGGITLIAAAAKSGKSTFAKEVGVFLSRSIPVLLIDTEMTLSEQVDRIVSSVSGVHIGKIETGKMARDEADKVKQTVNRLNVENYKFSHRCVAGYSFDEILATIKRWIYKDVGQDEEGKTNPCLVIYDYFKIMNHQKELTDLKEYEAIYYNASRLTDFAKELDFPVLAFVQLNREEKIAQSQRLEWIAKSICYLYRKTEEELKEFPMAGTGKLVPGQQLRYGHDALEPGDYINLMFDKQTNSIKEGPTYFEIKAQMGDSYDDDDDEDEVPF